MLLNIVCVRVCVHACAQDNPLPLMCANCKMVHKNNQMQSNVPG